MKVKFSQERGLKAGRFYDPNAFYIKMFDKKPPAAGKTEEVKDSNLPKMTGTLGDSG